MPVPRSEDRNMFSFFMALMLSPAVFAALVIALYWLYPIALLHGYRRFGGYLYAGLSRKFVVVGDIKYCYFERLPTAPSSHPITVLFVHGFSANKTMWMVMSKFLPQDWRIVMVDMPGHGESSFKSGSDYTPRGMSDKLNEFMDALRLWNVHLVGVSMGSLIAAKHSANYPGKVKSLSLMCIPVAHKLPNGVMTPFFKELVKGNILLLPRTVDEFQKMMELVLYNPSPYTFHHRFREALVKLQEPNYVYMEEIMQGLVSEKEGSAEAVNIFTSKIDVPTLILWGDSDKICHPSGAAIVGELIKNSLVVVVDNCGHAMPLDRPRKCAKLVYQFINKLDSGLDLISD